MIKQFESTVLSNGSDLIAAIATPLGTGAVAIVRLSGAGAVEFADSLFRSRSGRLLADLPGYTSLLGHLCDGEEPVDEAIAQVFRAPRSYTGEDMVELCCHGGAYLTQRVLQLCVDAGARPADPGEFTRRAFFGGKLDLTQAEAVADLIAAQGEGARRAALAARGGALSTETAELVENLSAHAAHLAAWADYPEEDMTPVDPAQLAADLRLLVARMDRLLSSYGKSRLLREGVATAIVGKPNVGKSTLMNLLSGEQRSIVTPLPGTTRDVVRETVRIGGLLLSLMDTAGIRDTDDPVEQMGVELARQGMASAQLVLAVFDSSCPLDTEDRALLSLLGDAPCVAVVNKSDLETRLELEELRAQIGRVVPVSATTGEGQDLLLQEIEALLQLDTLDTSAATLANERQRHCLQQAREALEEACTALLSGVTLDAATVCVEEALDQLLTLTGQRATERVVDEVFARFCVGK